MAQIYTKAEQVVIYLGESQDDSDTAMDWIRQIDDPDYDPPYISSRSRIIQPETQMLESLLSRPWFNRIWVLQDAVFSKSAIVYCGQWEISWDAIKQFKKFNASANWIEDLPHVIGRRHRTADTTVAVEFKVLTELLNARHCESTDPRDKVYALLPLLSHSGINSDIVPNYSHTAARVFTDVATYLISCIDLESLCTVCGRSELPGLLSWVPDWSIRVQRYILGFNQPRHSTRILRYRAGGPFVIPSMTSSQRVPSFTIDRVDQNGTFSAHLRMQALRLGKITGIGVQCADDEDIPPLRQWKTQWEAFVSTIALAENTGQIQRGKVGSFWATDYASTFGEYCGESHHCRNEGNDIFEYTVIAGNVVYRSVLREAVKKFARDNGNESRKVSIRQWMKCLAPSPKASVNRILSACRGRRFLTTDTWYVGLAPLEADSGDVVYLIPGVSVPFVLREDNDGFRLVGECYIQNVMDGEEMDGLDTSRMENIVIH
jgi:hypothetical protein